MNSFKEKAKEASRETSIIDHWGAATSTCPQSFTQGAEWGYKQAIADSAGEVKDQSDSYFDSMEGAAEPYFSQHAFAAEGMRTAVNRIYRLLRKLQK